MKVLGTRALAALALTAVACAAPVAVVKRSCRGFDPTSVAAIYPAERFLVGLGSVGGVWDPTKGAEPGRAAALADMASQLHAEVASAVSVHEWGDSRGGGGTRIAEAIDVKSKMVLKGARVVKSCFEPSQTTYYVVAVAEREALAKGLAADQVVANDRGIESLRLAREHMDAGRPLDALEPARAALAAAIEADQSAGVLRAITGTSAPDTFASQQQLSAFLAQVMDELGVRVAVRDPTGIVAGAIRDRLTGAGISLRQSGATVLVVAGLLEDLGDAGSSGGAVYVRLRVTVEVRRLDTGATLGSIGPHEEKGGGRSRDSARTAAANTLAAAVAPEVARMVGHVFGVSAVGPSDEPGL